MFQFQNGTIDRAKSKYLELAKSLFQFQNGTIDRFCAHSVEQYFLFVSIPKWYD